MTIVFEHAAIENMSGMDVHSLYKLRVDIFVHEQQCPYAEIDGTDADPQTLHVVARDTALPPSNQINGTARLFPDELAQVGQVAHIGRFVVSPRYRGTPLARTLLQHTMTLAAELYPGKPLYLTAQSPLVSYYSQFGFAPSGPEFDDEGIPHTPMLRMP